MAHDTDDRLATAAVLAHGALNSLTLVRYAFEVLDASSDKTSWSSKIADLVSAVPEQLDLVADHLRFIVTGGEQDAVDAMDELEPSRLETISYADLEETISRLFRRRLDRPLTISEEASYHDISDELHRRKYG